jgi:acetylglutamate synthase
VHATASAATRATAGKTPAGELRAAVSDPVTSRNLSLIVARKPSRMIGCSIHRHDAAARLIDSAASASHSQVPECG